MIFKEVLWPVSRKTRTVFKKEYYWFYRPPISRKQFNLIFLQELGIFDKPRLALLYGTNEFKN